MEQVGRVRRCYGVLEWQGARIAPTSNLEVDLAVVVLVEEDAGDDVAVQSPDHQVHRKSTRATGQGSRQLDRLPAASILLQRENQGVALHVNGRFCVRPAIGAGANGCF
jgi:hypothetical protein